MRVLLVAADGESRRQYEQELRAHGLEFDAVESLGELHDEMTRRPYNGILLDVPTMIRAGSDEKALTHDLLEIFPALRLSWDREERRIRSMYYGQTGETGNSLESFVETQVAPFAARTIRKSPRRSILACVRISGAQGHELAAVVNLSMEGCFVITSGPWAEGQPLELSFPDMEPRDSTMVEPISGVCRRVVAWGPGLRLPGIGVSFESMNPAQAGMVQQLLDVGGADK